MTIKKYTQKRIQDRLKGYCKFPRGFFLLLISGKVNISQFVLYIYLYAVLVDWDLKHKDTYGTFQFTNKEIAFALGWNSSTVSKNMKKLIELGLVFTNPLGLKELAGYKQIRNLLKTKSITIVNIEQILLNPQSYPSNDETIDVDEITQEFEMAEFLRNISTTSKNEGGGVL